jgi:hypothetical protein
MLRTSSVSSDVTKCDGAVEGDPMQELTLELPKALSNIGHERETNTGGHDVRHRASPQFSAPSLDTEYEKSQFM